MGMPVVIEVGGPLADGAIDEAFSWLRWVDATFSTYRPGSEICRIERGELRYEDADPLVREVLGRCDELRTLTRGFFDARAGGRLDPSGLVKGWAVDRAAAILERAGADRYCVNAGGDVLVRGGPWRVGIRHPRRADRLASVLELDAGAVATSASYERGAHIVDPHSGRPPRGILSVTVLGAELATADAFATAAYAMGRRAPVWTASLAGCEAMTILESERVLVTPGLLRHCPGGSPAASLAEASPPAPRAAA
jgi:FAD:protein FMN transferase